MKPPMDARCSLVLPRFMASMRNGVLSLVRQAFAMRGRVAVASPFRSIRTAPFPSTAASAPPSQFTITAGQGPCCRSDKPKRHQHQQQSGLSTLRRGLTGPLSARLRLPMRGLEEFRDSDIVKAGDVPIVGRSWTVQELRRKSFEDLHKLWFVLYKEKNMLLTQVLLSRRSKVPIPAGDRRQKVKRSMKAIRVVVGERQRAKRAVIRERQLAAKREKRQAAAAAAAAAATAAESEAAPGGDGSQSAAASV